MNTFSFIAPVKNFFRQRLNLSVKDEFHASIHPTDTFFVTYPKSGTTWMGFMISNVLNRKWNRDLNLRNFIEIVPDINNIYFNNKSLEEYSNLESPRVFMTHAPYDPAFPKVVYVLRDPRDVMVSYWHHKKLTDNAFDLTMKEFMLSDNHWPCNWDVHVKKWLLGNRKNILPIRYEDLQVKTCQILEHVLDFIGISYDPTTIHKAVLASRFDKMKQLEEKFGVDGANGSTDERFIRRGKVGAWGDELDEECLEILERKYGPVMKRVGYVTVIC